MLDSWQHGRRRSDWIFRASSTRAHYNGDMRYLTAALVTLTTALWFGGLVTLALLVMAVFISSGVYRENARRGTRSLFVLVGKAQLLGCAVALLATRLDQLPRRAGSLLMVVVPH